MTQKCHAACIVDQQSMQLRLEASLRLGKFYPALETQTHRARQVEAWAYADRSKLHVVLVIKLISVVITKFDLPRIQDAGQRGAMAICHHQTSLQHRELTLALTTLRQREDVLARSCFRRRQ